MKFQVLVQVVLLTNHVLSSTEHVKARCGESLTYNCSADRLTKWKDYKKKRFYSNTTAISSSLSILFHGDVNEYAQYSLKNDGTNKQTGNIINKFNVVYDHMGLDNGTPISVQVKTPLDKSWNKTVFICNLHYIPIKNSPTGVTLDNSENLLLPDEDSCTINPGPTTLKDSTTLEAHTTFEATSQTTTRNQSQACKAADLQEIPIHLQRSPIPIALFISSVIVAATIGSLYFLLFKYQCNSKQRCTEKRVRFASYVEIIQPEQQNKFDLMNVMKMARMKSLLENRKRPSSSTQSSSVPPPPPRGRSGTFGNLGSFAHSLWATVSSNDLTSEGKQGDKK